MEVEFLKMIGHGTNGSDGIEPGIHLRWAFHYKLGFPPCFKLYRRESKRQDLYDFSFEALGNDIPVPYEQASSDENIFLFTLESATVGGTIVTSLNSVSVQLPKGNSVNAISFSGELTFSFNMPVSRVELGFDISADSKFEIIALTEEGPYYPQTVLGTSRGFKTIAFDAPGTTGFVLSGIVHDKTHVRALSSVSGSISGAMSNHTHSEKAAR